MFNPRFSNRLLASIDADVMTCIYPLLTLVDMRWKTVIIEPNEPIEFVFFPEDCAVSILALTEDTPAIEVGMVGHEGMTDMVISDDGNSTPLRFIVQGAGTAWRMTARDFNKSAEKFPLLAAMAVKFRHVLAIQFAFTAYSHGTFNIEERLARWLLMSHDRCTGDEIPMVHEFLSTMLAVRRSGVTTAIHILEGRGAIRATRGLISIRDRTILQEIAGSSYGAPEKEYERLFG